MPKLSTLLKIIIIIAVVIISGYVVAVVLFMTSVLDAMSIKVGYEPLMNMFLGISATVKVITIMLTLIIILSVLYLTIKWREKSIAIESRLYPFLTCTSN